MKLSTKTRYGMRAMLELAEHSQSSPLQIKAIAQNQNISMKYLEQLIGILKTAGLVTSVRGAKGGYTLAKKPEQIKLSEIFTALEGPVDTAECLLDKNYCGKTAECITRQLWAQLQKVIINLLESLTLQDFTERAKNKALHYQI